MTGTIGISAWRHNGIGPEVALKALAVECNAQDVGYLVIGDVQHLRALNRQLGLNLPLEDYTGTCFRAKFQFTILGRNRYPPNSRRVQPRQPGSVAGCGEGARRCLSHELLAMVTAPVNKESIVPRRPELCRPDGILSELADAKRTAMMLLGEDEHGRWLRVALATTHVPLKKVSENLTAEKIVLVIEFGRSGLQGAGIVRARGAVLWTQSACPCEGGQNGNRRIDYDRPAVALARQNGLDATGPLHARTPFFITPIMATTTQWVAMYHDQGLGASDDWV